MTAERVGGGEVSPRARRVRLGYLGPAIVIVGAVVAGIAIWYMQTQRPVPGAVIDTFAIDSQRSLVVRREASSDRAFVELREGDAVKWRALVPPYAGAPGRPAIAWSEKAVTVRVSRNGRAEVFAFAMDNASKLGAFRLAADRGPIATHPQGPITLTDHVRAYEIVGGDGWHQLVAIDLVRGGGLWHVDLGAEPITAGGVDGGRVWVRQGAGQRAFDAATGRELPDSKQAN
jgi:hypothetical protein